MRIPAFIHLPAEAVAPAPADGFLLRLARYAALRFRLWRNERRTLGEIATLDAATLRDIGVSRWELREYLRAERDRVILRESGWRANA